MQTERLETGTQRPQCEGVKGNLGVGRVPGASKKKGWTQEKPLKERHMVQAIKGRDLGHRKKREEASKTFTSGKSSLTSLLYLVCLHI